MTYQNYSHSQSPLFAIPFPTSIKRFERGRGRVKVAPGNEEFKNTIRMDPTLIRGVAEDYSKGKLSLCRDGRRRENRKPSAIPSNFSFNSISLS